MKTFIYIADTEALDDKEKFYSLYQSVPKYRQDKIDAYKTEKDKKLSLGTGLLLSHALKEAGYKETELELIHAENGKPCFKRHDEIHFSLSHSEKKVMCAISSTPIGCDVEYITNNNEKDLDNWTKMESYVKASDVNMIDLLKGNIGYDPEYIFKRLSFNDGYKYMICSKEAILDSQIIKINF